MHWFCPESNNTEDMDKPFLTFVRSSSDAEFVSGLRNIFTDNSCSDVTFVCDDEEQVQAHKVVLLSVSPLLKDLFLDTPGFDSQIILSGFKQQVLQTVLEFIYFGQTSVGQDDLRDFLDLTKCFLIYDAIEPFITQNINNDLTQSDSDKNDLITLETMENILEEDNSNRVINESNAIDICEEMVESVGNQILDERMQNQKDFDGKTHGVSEVSEGEGEGSENEKCDQCEYESKFPSNLNRHIKSEHDKFIFSCSYCSYQAKRQDTLKNHQRNKHEGVKYYCDQCEYKTGWKSSLRKHQNLHK